MSQIGQQDMITSGRILIDDTVDGKTLFAYSPLLGNLDGVNTIFQIPQPRLIAASIIPVVNDSPVDPSNFTVVNAKTGIIQFKTAPVDTDSLSATCSFVWMDDIEMDGHLMCAARECGFSAYYTSFDSVTGTSKPATIPTDIPDALISAIEHLGGYHVAEALGTRFATKYDTEAGDHTFSPSSMAERYNDIAERLHKVGLATRDDFFKGLGRQYRPAISSRGWPLSTYIPVR